MKETQEILLKMGFSNLNTNVWESEWFGLFILSKHATPVDLVQFIYYRGVRNFNGDKAPKFEF